MVQESPEAVQVAPLLLAVRVVQVVGALRGALMALMALMVLLLHMIRFNTLALAVAVAVGVVLVLQQRTVTPQQAVAPFLVRVMLDGLRLMLLVLLPQLLLPLFLVTVPVGVFQAMCQRLPLRLMVVTTVAVAVVAVLRLWVTQAAAVAMVDKVSSWSSLTTSRSRGEANVRARP